MPCTEILTFVFVAGNVVLNSSIELGRHFSCERDHVNFTCEVFDSLFLQWNSPRFSGNPITYSTGLAAPISTSRPPFSATLTSITGIGSNTDFISTLQVTASRAFQQADTTVECRNQQGESREASFTAAGTFNIDRCCS